MSKGPQDAVWARTQRLRFKGRGPWDPQLAGAVRPQPLGPDHTLDFGRALPLASADPSCQLHCNDLPSGFSPESTRRHPHPPDPARTPLAAGRWRPGCWRPSRSDCGGPSPAPHADQTHVPLDRYETEEQPRRRGVPVAATAQASSRPPPLCAEPAGRESEEKSQSFLNKHISKGVLLHGRPGWWGWGGLPPQGHAQWAPVRATK